MADNSHKSLYKNSGKDPKELRRQRADNSVELRKSKRDEFFSKRRTLAPVSEPDSSESQEPVVVKPESTEITPDVIAALLQDTDRQLLLENAQKVRKILSKEPQPPFDEVIASGLIPRFVQLLDRDDETTIQFEVAWILTNIASGTSEQTRVIVDNGAVPKLVKLLYSPDMKVCEQTVWALGNIIGEGAEYRDMVINHGFVPALLNLIRPDLDIGFLRNETWVLVNLCRNKDPPPNINVVMQLTPALNYLIQSTDLAILIDTAWAISYIAELGPDYAQLVIDSGLVSRMTPLLSIDEMKIQTAAIRALGSIVTGDEAQTQCVVDAGALSHLQQLLLRSDRISKEALWFVSNITAGSTDQIQAVIDNGLIPTIITCIKQGDSNHQKEAAWTFYNLVLSGSAKQIEYIYRQGVVPPLCSLLDVRDSSVVRNVLETLSCILQTCQDETEDICNEIESCDGLDKIEILQNHQSEEIYNLAFHIIDQYFS